MHDENTPPAPAACWHVTISAGGARFAAPSGRSLLEAAEAAGLAWASSCRNGTCRTCIRRLLDGRVAYRIEWPGLLADEKAQGWILPCVACPRSDLVVEAGGTADAQMLPVT
ncbi:MAG TPA: 2Fe-2S iron-sulfur cluster-binding protein [Ramlibacter sp.]|jgi:ferredoxin|uniref:2Fe-2S iron-sulfur cluster-binding protein n=1 Tax=Ramlibacter sp. TaxID=1917967 RepID=UPI002D307137|nr:2Fe-2S iron-sulfur cluster-binding protein [Ramlibacter sp.]HZY20403.1 2Fe-2S iron-sulfur cluster-binding protein [Ramlibacter sp.]